jgi:hypothetical protein
LDEAQRRRDELLAEMSRAERIRRIAPSARLRAEHLAALEATGATIELAAQREEAAEAAMAEAASAGRARPPLRSWLKKRPSVWTRLWRTRRYWLRRISSTRS